MDDTSTSTPENEKDCIVSSDSDDSSDESKNAVFTCTKTLNLQLYSLAHTKFDENDKLNDESMDSSASLLQNRQSTILASSRNVCFNTTIVIPDITITTALDNSKDDSNKLNKTTGLLNETAIFEESCKFLDKENSNEQINLNKKNVDKTISTTPIKSVHDLRKQFSPNAENDNNAVSIPRIVITKSTPEKTENKLNEDILPKKKVVSPVAEYRKGNAVVVGKKIVLKNF